MLLYVFSSPTIHHVLSAQCASASRWASHDIITLPDGTRRDPFAEYHASKTRQYIDRTMASGQDIFDVMQACIILSWYFYQEGRWVEVWIFAGFQTRVAIPLRLNYPGTFTTQGNASPGAYLAPPRDMRDLECRRRAWWMTMLFDRIVAVVSSVLIAFTNSCLELCATRVVGSIASTKGTSAQSSRCVRRTS
jgi:hypothetical protein